jgi:hypothetical protein
LPWFRKDRAATYEEQVANNIYLALVESGGPGSDSDSYVGARELGIRVADFDRYALKDRLRLEVFLCAAFALESAQGNISERLLHAFAHLLQQKWAARGIRMQRPSDVIDSCLDEIGRWEASPFGWARRWIEEFYDPNEDAGDYYIPFGEFALHEFEAMKGVVRTL